MRLNIETIPTVGVLKTIDTMTYKASQFDLIGNYTGFRTKTCIIGTGLPDHKDLGEFSDVEIFIDHTNAPDDAIGLSTMYAGIIASNNAKDGLKGLAPKTKMYYAKCVNEDGEYNTNSIIASILWALVQEVDVIILGVLPLEKSSYFDQILEKAQAANIPIFVPASMYDEKIASFPFVFQVKSKKGKKLCITISDNIICVTVPSGVYTTFTANRYIESNADVVATSFAAGLALLLVQKSKHSNSVYSCDTIYKQLVKK
jgi:Subtilase family